MYSEVMKKIIFLASIVAASPAWAFYLGLPLHSASVAAAKKNEAIQSADAGTCYTISDSDIRAFCLAKAHNDSGRCYSIQRQDVRAMCLAEVRK